MIRTTALVALTAAFGIGAPASADLLTNASFDTWSGTAPNDTPDGWTVAAANRLTEVASLDGPGSSALFTNATNIFQNLSSALTDDFSLQFDFQINDLDADVTGSDRGMNATFRNAGNTPFLNVRTSDTGELEFFNGSGWSAIASDPNGSQSELITNNTDVYRIQIVGTIGATAGSSSYDVTLLNLTDSTTAASGTGLTFFQNDPVGDQFDRIRFDRGSNDFDWTLDNVIVAVPEPGSLSLIALGGGLLLARRRG